ncbi:hypothetical protein IEQ34_014163 [Dendrobium chrysotoxum]|uniref:Myb/SANT-like DNA-binding domain-containing protein n=1 Tax=Dendrobium chrysotoxum TaxID=161865 RepID=A0AAV7GI79_DENCH|nr:hypothetical protein IEQ34_014163 [Dendrobium chrysotoxum]
MASSPPSPAVASPPAPPLSAPQPTRRGLPPPCWSHDETLALIESYRHKWHSLRCANLRAADWDEVAADLSRRSSLLPSATPKTSVQCRHKIEKLRKRFRSDRLRSLTLRPHTPPSSSWPFFPFMESLEQPPSASLSGSPSHSDDADNSRPIRRLVSNGEGLRFTVPKAVRSKKMNPSSGGGKLKGVFSDAGVKPAMEEMRRRLERKRKEEMEAGTAGGMVAALRLVGDGFMRIEQVKLDMARETERIRMEMELKRTEMILDSQQRIVDAFVESFVGGVKRKKGKVSPDS